MADEGGGEDVGIGFKMDPSQAEAALRKVENQMRVIEVTLGDIAKASREANEKISSGAEVAEHFRGQMDAVGNAVMGAFSIEGARQFFDYIARRQDELAGVAEKTTGLTAAVLSKTGDVLDKRTAEAIQKNLAEIQRASPLPNEEVINLYGDVRGVIGAPSQVGMASEIVRRTTTGALGLLGEEGAKQRETVAAIAARGASAGLTDPQRLFDMAVRASTTGMGTESLEKITEGLSLAPGREGEMFQAGLAVYGAAARAGVGDKAASQMMDALMEARTKTTSVNGREVLVAPTLAGMDPVAGLRALASGRIPQGEVEALLPGLGQRQLGGIAREYEGLYGELSRGVDLEPGVRKALGPVATIREKANEIDTVMDARRPLALQQKADRDTQSAFYQRAGGGGLMSEIADLGVSGMMRVLQTLNPGWRPGGSGAPQQEVQVVVRVQADKDLDVQAGFN